MSKKEKLFARLQNNPFDVTFAEIRLLLGMFGFELSRVTGSHHIFKRDSVTFVIPVHDKKHVKSVYVRRVIQIIKQLEGQQ